MCIRFYDGLEDLLGNTGYQSFQFGVIYIGTLCGAFQHISKCSESYNTYHHGERLSTTSLTVSEDRAIVSVENIWFETRELEDHSESRGCQSVANMAARSVGRKPTYRRGRVRTSRCVE